VQHEAQTRDGSRQKQTWNFQSLSKTCGGLLFGDFDSAAVDKIEKPNDLIRRL
jgi:hypothetical protein